VIDRPEALARSPPETPGIAKTQVIVMNSPSSRSIPELFSDAVSQLAKLVSNEFELARAELSEKANRLGRGVALMGAGALMLVPALVLVLFAMTSRLIQGGFSEPSAYLISGDSGLIVSIALIAFGMKLLSADVLKPSVTLEQIQRDKVAAKELLR